MAASSKISVQTDEFSKVSFTDCSSTSSFGPGGLRNPNKKVGVRANGPVEISIRNHDRRGVHDQQPQWDRSGQWESSRSLSSAMASSSVGMKTSSLAMADAIDDRLVFRAGSLSTGRDSAQDSSTLHLLDPGTPRTPLRRRMSYSSSELQSVDHKISLTSKISRKPSQSSRRYSWVEAVTAASDWAHSETKSGKKQGKHGKGQVADNKRKQKPIIITISRQIVELKLFMILTTLLTIYALVGDDVRLTCTNLPADDYFNGITIFCITVFLLEVVLSSLGKDDYFGGFFFLLDCISTATLVLDLTWINDMLQGDEEDMDNLQGSKTARLGARTARVVRVIRLVRILKLYKAIYEARARAKRIRDRKLDMEPGGEDRLFDTDENDSEMKVMSLQRGSRVGRRLSDLTTRKVILLVLTMMLALPLLRVDVADQLPFSPFYAADLVHESFVAWQNARNVNSADQGTLRGVYVYQMLQAIYYHNWYTGHADECPGGKDCSKEYYNHLFWVGVVTYQDRVDLLQQRAELAHLTPDEVAAWEATVVSAQEDDYMFGSMPHKVQQTLGAPWTAACHGKYTQLSRLGFSLLQDEISGDVPVSYAAPCPESLRRIEREVFFARSVPVSEAREWHFAFYFDKRMFVRQESVFSLVTTAFVCVVLTVASILFTNDADKLVLNPLEVMISKVEKIRANPLLAMKLSDDDLKREEFRKYKKTLIVPTTWHQRWRDKLYYLRDRLCCVGEQEISEPMETVILEKTIIKIGSLLALGFGEAGANIIEHNMSGVDSAMVTAMVEGEAVDCIIGCARIQNFSITTEVLRGNVMTFVNQIAEIVHGLVDEFHGSANKNNGDLFLLIWRTSGLDEHFSSKLADMSMVAFTRILGAINRSPVLAQYRQHPGLQQRLGKHGKHLRVNLTFSLHHGWAIEGAVGSEFKIDASYLSPNVSIAEALEAATSIYGVPVLCSEMLVEMCSKPMFAKCRLIDRVLLTGTSMNLFTIDLDYQSLVVDWTPSHHLLWNPRQRFRCRQYLEGQKALKCHDDVRMVDYFNADPDVTVMRFRYTVEFHNIFNMGYQNYMEGEWKVAQRFLSRTWRMLGVEDGPSAALFRYMESYQFMTPPGWKGIRDLEKEPLFVRESTFPSMDGLLHTDRGSSAIDYYTQDGRSIADI